LYANYEALRPASIDRLAIGKACVLASRLPIPDIVARPAYTRPAWSNASTASAAQ
jgi:hypothetical protein